MNFRHSGILAIPVRTTDEARLKFLKHMARTGKNLATGNSKFKG